MMKLKLFTAKIVTLLALGVTLQGCVGVMTQHTSTRETILPQIGNVASPNAVDAPKICCDSPNHNSVQKYSACWLEENWGKPDKIEFVEMAYADQIWTYKFDLRWNGATVFAVVVPVPLLLPAGKEKVEFYIKDGDVIGAKQTLTEKHVAIAGLLVGPCGFRWVVEVQ